MVRVEGDFLGISDGYRIDFYKDLSSYNIRQFLLSQSNFWLNLTNDEFYVANSKMSQYKLEGNAFQEKIFSSTFTSEEIETS